MKNVNLALRTAIGLALNDNIVYSGQNIATFEEYLQETDTRKIAKFIEGNRPAEAYIVLLNQTSNDDSAKCMRNDIASIQIQITTVFPANKGGSSTAEKISELVMARLFTEDGLNSTLDLGDDMTAWRGRMEGCINIPYDTNTNRIWITQMIVEYAVTQ